MRRVRHAILDLGLRAVLALAAACVLSACASDPVAGVPNLLTNVAAECDIGPSWNETPIWDSGEVRLIWRYHAETAWDGVCGTSSWGCIHCKWEGGERVCTVDLRIRPRFSRVCHMAVLGHELGHALGKMHDEDRARPVPASFVRPSTPPVIEPDAVATLVPAAPVAEPVNDPQAVALLVPPPLPDLSPIHLDAMLDVVKPVEDEAQPTLAEPAPRYAGASVRLDRTHFEFRAPLR